MVATPHEPRERHPAIGLAALPIHSVHHGQALAEAVDPGESATLEDFRATIGFIKSPPKKHDHEWADLDRVCDELLDQLECRICQDALVAGRHPLHQEVAPVEMRRVAVVD